MNILSGLLFLACLLSSGYLPLRVFSKFIQLRISWSEKFHALLSLGVLIVIIPGIYFGLLPSGNFSFYYRLLLILCLLSILLIIYDFVNYLFSNSDLNIRISTGLNPFFFLALILAFSLLLFNFLLPQLRGFDAFWRYFPESLVYYQLNRIPLVNYLNFRPITYEPVNTLIYAFSYYLTNEQNLIFIPALFFIALIVLVYDISLYYFKEKRKAYISIILFCSLPLIHWLIEYWVFYQELYIVYFFTLSIFCLIKYLSSRDQIYLLLSSITLTLTLLSKISGWVILPIFLFIIPFGKYDKKIKFFFLFCLWLVLSVLASTITFFWLFIPLAVYTIIIGYSVYNSSLESNIKKIDYLFIFSLLTIATLAGGYWLYKISQRIPSGYQNPFLIYFGGDYISYKFPLITSGYNLILEHSHAADIITSSFVILFGVAFVPSWLLPKIFGFNKFKNNYHLYIWTFIPLMVWLTEFGLVYSIRYILPISIPLVIVLTEGVFECWNILRHYLPKLPTAISSKYIALVALFGMFNFYPTIPLIFLIKFPIDTVQINGALENSYLFNAFWYYQLFIGLFSGFLVYILFKLSSEVKFRDLKSKINFPKFFRFPAYFFAFITIIFIMLAPFSILLTVNNFDINSTNAVFDPTSSKDYQEVVEYLTNENVINTTIFTVYVPGLSYFTNIPSIDLKEDIKLIEPLFENNNISIDLELFNDPLSFFKQNYSINFPLNNPSLGYVAIPNINHYTYDYFKADFSSKYIFFDLLDNQAFFKKVIDNNQYRLYKIVEKLPHIFYGIFKIAVVTESDSVNLFSNTIKKSSQTANLSIGMDFSVINIKPQNPKLQITFESDNRTFVQNYYMKDFVMNGNFSFFNLDLQKLKGVYSIKSISLSDSNPISENIIKIINITLPTNTIISDTNSVSMNVTSPISNTNIL
jgi:hypothetical protein